MISVAHTPGDFIGPGDTLLVAWSKSPCQGVSDDIRDCFILGKYRTMVQDPELGITQLVNIIARSVRFFDPSIPSMVLNQLGVALSFSAERGNPCPYRQDKSGSFRLILKTRSFDQLMSVSFDPIRYYSRDNPNIIALMLNTIGRIASHGTSDEIRKVLLQHAMLIKEESVVKISSEHDRQIIRQSYDTAVRTIGLPSDGLSS